MPQSTYERVRLAAERLLRDDAHGRWALADAVLEAVQANHQRGGGTNPPRAGVNGVEDQLAQLVDLLTADGAQTPFGDPYTVDALVHLRETAMAWLPDQRHDEAAYRTHQEAGGPNTEGGKALTALCAVARGERPRRPSFLDSEAWDAAVGRIQAKLARPRVPRFPVAANDLRVAMRRTPNVPGPSRNPRGEPRATPGQVAAALADPEQRAAAMEELTGIDPDLTTTVALSAVRAGQRIDDPADAGVRAEARTQGDQEREVLGRARARLDLESLLRSITGETRTAIRLAQTGELGVFSDLDEQITTVITMLHGLLSIISGEGTVTDDDLVDLLEGGE